MIASIYAPFACIECGVENDALLCGECMEAVPRCPSRCYRCRATTKNYSVCNGCKPRTPLKAVAVWAHHENAAKALIHAAKYERARSGLVVAANSMKNLIRYFPEVNLVIPVPTATSRVRERGYDQSVVIAKEVARSSSLPVSLALARLNQAHQVGSTRAERIRHVRGGFRVRNAAMIKGKHVLLIDDVCTTGATLEEAARTLKKAGVANVYAVVFSQPN